MTSVAKYPASMLTVVGRGKSGAIIVRDDRGADAYVLLICEEVEPSGGGGVVAAPDEIWPTGRESVENMAFALGKTTGTEPFTLDVDISQMPPGELRFRSREFIEKAVDTAETAERTYITPENAKQWGYVESYMTGEPG
jgi:hypothetical protein